MRHALSHSLMKRLFDIVVSLAGLVLLSPLLLLVAVLVKADSRGPIFFRQERMGRGFRSFSIYKFRTMVWDASRKGQSITVGNDPRITPAGRFLRATKIDELPQLINVLKGEMSFVGPRPEIRQYVELFRKDYEEILKIRPGITDLASVKYRDEAAILGRSENPEDEYVRRVLPEKIELAKEYLRRSSLFFDLSLIFKTLFSLFSYTSELKPSHGTQSLYESISLSQTTGVQPTTANPVGSPHDHRKA
jgi:lipopolysaccharide/colanic/teichoic acid biosynthesis glycosyltransferase